MRTRPLFILFNINSGVIKVSFATRDDAPLPRCKNERFFYGNVPHLIIGIVSPLPGRALATYLAIWDRCKLEGHGSTRYIAKRLRP